MIGDDDTVSPQELEQVFVAVKGLQGLAQGGVSRPVTFSEIYHFVSGSYSGDARRVEMAVQSDLRVRGLLNLVVGQQSVAVSLRAALAQDSAVLEQRSGDGFTLKFRASHAKEGQVYVILEIMPALGIADGRSLSLIVVDEGRVSRIVFPPLADGRSQAILLESDEKLGMLRNPELELNLVPG